MLRVENLEVDKTKFLALKLFTFQKGRRVKRKVNNQVLHVLTPGAFGVQRRRCETAAWVLKGVDGL